MGILLDSDVLIEIERGGALERLDQIAPDQDRSISVITVSELLQGVLRADANHRAQRGAFVEHLLDALDAIPVSPQVARTHAALWAELASTGSPIGSHDLWIAATAVAHGLSLATGNTGEFARVPGLALVEV